MAKTKGNILVVTQFYCKQRSRDHPTCYLITYVFWTDILVYIFKDYSKCIQEFLKLIRIGFTENKFEPFHCCNGIDWKHKLKFFFATFMNE